MATTTSAVVRYEDNIFSYLDVNEKPDEKFGWLFL